MKTLFLAGLLAASCFAAIACDPSGLLGVPAPKDGLAPDAATAIAVAKAVWCPIYGRENIDKEAPFHATLRKGVWTVTGSLQDGMHGGVAEAEIAQIDGRVIRIIHGK